MTSAVEQEARALALLQQARLVLAYRRDELDAATDRLSIAVDEAVAAECACARAGELVADAMLHLIRVAPDRALRLEEAPWL